MSFGDITGQERVVKLLRRGLQEGRIAHAYCFAGPKGVGKERMAHTLALALNCELGREDPCGNCRSCRQIKNGNHPDMIWLDPEGQRIKIEQIRRLKQQFAFSTKEKVTPVVGIRHAEKMTGEAANSLLKFLEEPTSRMVAVLMTEQPYAILPTILSRCQLLRFAPLAPAGIARQLEEEGIDPRWARVAAHLVGGVQPARELAGLDSFAFICERVIKWSEEIVSGRSDALVSVQTSLLTEEGWADHPDKILDLLLLWLRDLLNQQLGREGQAVFTPWSKARQHQASMWTSTGLAEGMDRVARARNELTGNVQPQGVLERLVLTMQGGANHVGSRRSPLSTSG